ncbi:MAG: hypothetical protein ACLTQI_08250 [Slackia sp.]
MEKLFSRRDIGCYRIISHNVVDAGRRPGGRQQYLFFKSCFVMPPAMHNGVQRPEKVAAEAS